jgi:hypothetical protein
MHTRILKAITLAALLVVAVATQIVAAQDKLPVVNVTVQYTGKSPVTEKTPIWVFLFNTADPTDGQTPPLAAKRLAKNGGVVQFEYASSAPLYVFVSLDREGGYDGNSGPPAAGSPIGSYSTDGKTAAAVHVMPTTNIKVTFNDSVLFKP